MAWDTEIPRTDGMTYIFGNPPFVGARIMSPEQKKELSSAWGGIRGSNQLDYVTGWHAKSKDFFASRDGCFAFVTTNSIVQGQAVATLFAPLFESGWRIRFAHRTFSWDSEAPGKAAVHCVIVGFDRENKSTPQLWDYPDIKGEPVAVPVEKEINGYLVDGENVLIEARSSVLSSELSPVRFGSMPNDKGFLVPKSGTPRPSHDEVAMKYVHPFLGGRELLHNEDRWCLWMAEDTFDPGDIERSKELKERVLAVQKHRLASKRDATRKLASTPFLFGEVRQPRTIYLAIPKVVSERRRYYICSTLTPNVIASDLLFTVEDPDGLQFALVSSSMFIIWQKTIGGRLESRLRFSNTLTWNTFPVPQLSEQQREKIIKTGKNVLKARELHPERSLAEHYNPLAMAPELVKAHEALDREVDKAFGASRKLTTERQRQELLFENYAKLTS